MNYLIEKLSSIGVKKEDSFSGKRIIRIVNQAALISVFFCLLSMFANIVTGYYSAAVMPLISGLFFALVPYFNYKGKYSEAKLMLSGIGYLATTLVVIFVEIDTYTFNYFICVFATTIVFFPSKKQLWISLAVTFLCLGVSLSASYFHIFPKMEIVNPLFFGVFNLILILLLLAVLMSSITKENSLFQERTTELLGNLNDANNELTQEKNKVEATNLHLEQEILEREKVENSLRESNQLLQQFAYVASHDMKEPLRTIGSFSGLLARKLKGKLEKDEEEYLDYITNGVGRMSVLLDDLLEYASLSKPVTFEQIKMTDALHIVTSGLKNLIERKNVDIQIGTLPSLVANSSQLRQVFQNLISNGIKFNNTEKPIIQINCTENAVEYKFSVQDNGIGIPLESQARIWKIFQRLHSRGQFEGSGIGLAVVQKVVSNHRGQIWVDSIENKGTTFYFTVAKSLCAASTDVAELQEKAGEESVQN